MVESASRSQASLRQVFEEMLITLYFSYILKCYSSGNCCVTKRHSGIPEQAFTLCQSGEVSIGASAVPAAAVGFIAGCLFKAYMSEGIEPCHYEVDYGYDKRC